jgi:hypothetical protein
MESRMKVIATYVVAVAVSVIATFLLAQTPAAPSPAISAARAMPGVDARDQMAQMDEQMRNLQTQHARMMSATTPAERQQWMDQQHESMREGMAIMARMMQNPRMSGRTREAISGRRDGSTDADETMQMMMKGIEMMQLMTRLMMDQLGLTRDARGVAAPAKR